MAADLPTLCELSEVQRAKALERFHVLRPFLEDRVPLTEVVKSQPISLITARRWVARYRNMGLVGLASSARADQGIPRSMTEDTRKLIEGLALQKPRKTIAFIHRTVTELTQQQGLNTPSYSTVYAVVRNLDAGLMTLAHNGSKAYKERFDLLHRHEADGPNAVWQADHTLLDIWLLDEKGKPARPWLSVIMDDYSRAIAGYYLTFSAPSAIQTALALRQAIWRKTDPGWHVCGIPDVLYTDHGSDFVSKHIEQVGAELKMQLVFSLPGQPRGRGKIERFFHTVNQMLLMGLDGHTPRGHAPPEVPTLTLPQLANAFEAFLLEYHQRPRQGTGPPPQARWESNGFTPRLPATLETLDLLLLTVAKSRRVRQDGIYFQSLRYIDPTLAAYVGEDVVIRYDPTDMAEIRVYHGNSFLCRAVCPELASDTISLKDIIAARTKRRRELKTTLTERTSLVDALLGRATATPMENPASSPLVDTNSDKPLHKLKRYFNE